MNEATWSIVIAPNGFVLVGRVHRDGDHLVVRDGGFVRRYSLQTKDGLGGLAVRGPTKDNDVIDRAPLSMEVHVLQVVAKLECDAAAWDAWISTFAPQQAAATTPTVGKSKKR